MPARTTHTGELRALVADDDAAFQMLMEQALSDAGFETLCVSNGAEALARVQSYQPNLVFLDNLMPEMNGLQACAAMREQLGGSGPPIIVVTSGDTQEDISAAFSSGATDYLVKPVNWHLFKHRLSGWLSHADNEHRGVDTGNSSDKLLVARNGSVIEVLQRGNAHSLIGDFQDPESLSDTLPGPVCQAVTASIAKVLKTRSIDTTTFEMERNGQANSYEVTVAAKGRGRAELEIRLVPGEANARQELFRLAYIDPITGVPNRHLFDLSARDRMERARFKSRSLTFLCLTFDRIADARTDQPYIRKLLSAVAANLSENLRGSDHLVRFDVPDASSPPIASLDGAHFLILIDHAETDPVIDAVISRIQDTCKEIELGRDESIQLEPRVGVSCFPSDGEDLDELVDAALLATRDARQFRESVRRFGSNSNVRGNVQLDLENELRHALESGQVCLFYQPRIDLESERVIAAEALIRWQHPFRGHVPVRELFDIAAAAGEVDMLTEWAFREACKEAKSWDTLPYPIKVSINLSREQLIRRDFAASVIAMLEELQMDPAVIELEMRESLLDCTDQSLQQLQQLRDVGVGIIVDDFGSDRTSLLTLRRLRIDGFKVNHDLARAGSLVNENSGVYSIAIAIAQARNAVLIAKGIETDEELSFVKSRFCQQAQGFHICQPLPAADFRHYIEEAEQSGSSLLEVAESI